MGETALSIVVVGASGDLARRKIYPALFALYSQGYLPDDMRVFGFSRSEFSDEAFRKRITEHLTCRYVPGESCAERMDAFLARCHYCAGQYDSSDSFLDLYTQMKEHEGGPANRLFYLAIPPRVFTDVASAIGDAGLVACDASGPWSRVVIEKPFGRDRASSDELTRELATIFSEDQTYRIDHYLGKEVIQNLMVLRFANRIFEPMWNREHIGSVRISWKEDLSIEGRGGYFDEYGIIRDVMQNHLLQILALVAMEPPANLDGRAIRDEKVRVLKCISPVDESSIVVGQYGPGRKGNSDVAGYTDDDTVPDGSRTPTFASCALHIDNPRWQGVPFLLEAGKGLGSRLTEIIITFREVSGNVFCKSRSGCPPLNQLGIRVQPDEAIYFRVTNKVPGPGMRLETRNLDLRYREAFDALIPDAYENLLLDVLKGEKGLFIRGDELAAAWDIFTPALHHLDSENREPEIYPFGSHGPAAAAALARREGMPDGI